MYRVKYLSTGHLNLKLELILHNSCICPFKSNCIILNNLRLFNV